MTCCDLKPYCKAMCKRCYTKAYRSRPGGKEQIAKYHKTAYKKHKGKILAKHREWRKANWSKHRALVDRSTKIWRKKNKDRYALTVTHGSNLRRARKLHATPQWADLDAIKQIYKNRPKGYHVDHIIPLKGKNVSGLHVAWNLQYLPAKENLSKGNKLV